MNTTTFIELVALFSDGRKALMKDFSEVLTIEGIDKGSVLEACSSSDGVRTLIDPIVRSSIGVHEFKNALEWVKSFSHDISSFHKQLGFVLSGGGKHI